MELVCPPWLHVVRSDAGEILLEDLSLHCTRTLDPNLASLLEELHEPVAATELTSHEQAGISDNLISQLLRAGLLVESGRPSWFGLFAPFQPTFLSCPDSEPEGADVCVIGVPCEAHSTTGPGPAEGPAAMRVASAFLSYQTDQRGTPSGFFDYDAGQQILRGIKFTDLGDIHMPRGEAAEAAGLRLSRAVFACRRLGSFPLILGGDHSLTFAAVRGLADTPISILHLDAHSDIMETEDHLLPSNGSVIRSLLQEEFVRRVVTVGVRGILQIEQRPLREGHVVVSARRFRELGAAAIAELVSDPCYVSLDIDVLDPAIAPGTNVPVPSGLTTEELCSIFSAVMRRVKIIGADIVEISPRHDVHMRTARVAVDLSLRLLAEVFAGREESLNGELTAAIHA